MSKSGKAKKSGEKLVHKYASEFVGNIIDQLSEKHITTAKNPNSVQIRYI